MIGGWPFAVVGVVRAVPSVVAVGADTVDVPFDVAEGVLVRAVVDVRRGVAGAPNNGLNTATSSSKPSPFASHPLLDRELARRFLAP